MVLIRAKFTADLYFPYYKERCQVKEHSSRNVGQFKGQEDLGEIDKHNNIGSYPFDRPKN